jgi:hypothetical protein
MGKEVGCKKFGLFSHLQMTLERAAMGKRQILGKDPGISKFFRKNGKMSQRADTDAAGKRPSVRAVI